MRASPKENFLRDRFTFRVVTEEAKCMLVGLLQTHAGKLTH
jgi:hypothetical protein